jgi:hypothetical protein
MDTELRCFRLSGRHDTINRALNTAPIMLCKTVLRKSRGGASASPLWSNLEPPV